MATVVLPEATRALYPFKSQYVTLSDGQRMHYVDEGPPDGEVLLFAHGYPTWSFLYRTFLIYYAARGFRSIAIDHVGWGLSDKPPTRRYHTLRRHIHNLREFVTALDLTGITLVMEDWGTAIGLGCAIRELDRVKRLVIMNAWVFQDTYPLPLHPFVQLVTRPGIGELMFRSLNLALNLGLQRWTVRPLSPAVMTGYKAPFRDLRSRTALYQFPRMISTTPTHPTASMMREIESELTTLDRLPTLVLWGQNESVFAPSMARHWAKLMPRATGPIMVDNANHFLPEDAPENVILNLDDFLEQTNG